MSTTNVNFVLQKKSATAVDGVNVLAAPYVEALEHQAALVATQRVPGGQATGFLLSSNNNGNYLCDDIPTRLDKQGFAKNGAYHCTTSGTTGVTIDLTNLTTGATTTAGDTSFATVYQLTFLNAGTGDMTIAPGGSNPSLIPKFGGTSPTVTLPAGSSVVFQSVAGVTVNSTQKTILVTPSTGGDLVVAVGGA